MIYKNIELNYAQLSQATHNWELKLNKWSFLAYFENQKLRV